MQVLSFFAQFVLAYILLIAVTVIMIWMSYGFHTVNGQMAFIFVMVAGVPGAFKLVRDLRRSA